MFGKTESSVARWYIFKPKIPIWENFGVSAMKDVGKILCP
jgi:hypothetical protein